MYSITWSQSSHEVCQQWQWIHYKCELHVSQVFFLCDSSASIMAEAYNIFVNSLCIHGFERTREFKGKCLYIFSLDILNFKGIWLRVDLVIVHPTHTLGNTTSPYSIMLCSVAIVLAVLLNKEGMNTMATYKKWYKNETSKVTSTLRKMTFTVYFMWSGWPQTL